MQKNRSSSLVDSVPEIPFGCSTIIPNIHNARNGQIYCIVDTADSGRSVSYTYDPIGRLSSALTHGSANYPVWGLSWAYDRYANRTSQTVTAGTAPSSSLTFNTATNQPTGYTFNASGDMTVEPFGASSYQYGYDAEERMTSVSGAAGAAYTYDGKGVRVQKALTGGTTTVYVFALGMDIAEYDNGAAVASPSREYIYSGDTLISTVSAGTTNYHHADHLSVRVTTDANGNIVGQQGHFPYGEPWYSASTTTKFLFTSYEHDSETGLDYALARYYDSRMGRFCSPDPVDGWPDDPQSWNRYAYSRNDPVNLTDPSGKNWLVDFFEAIAMILVDILFPPAAPAMWAAEGGGAQLDNLLINMTVDAMIGMSHIPGYTLPSANAMQGQVPKGYTACPPVWFRVKAPGPDQANQKGGAAGVKNVKAPGNVAYNPADFDITREQAQQLDRSKNPILFQPDWSTAKIPTFDKSGNTVGYAKPTSKGPMQKFPQGSPTSPNATLQGKDTLGGVGSHGNPPNTIDEYGYKNTPQARAATRDVLTTVYIPDGSGANCPQGTK